MEGALAVWYRPEACTRSQPTCRPQLLKTPPPSPTRPAGSGRRPPGRLRAGTDRSGLSHVAWPTGRSRPLRGRPATSATTSRPTPCRTSPRCVPRDSLRAASARPRARSAGHVSFARAVVPAAARRGAARGNVRHQRQHPAGLLRHLARQHGPAVGRGSVYASTHLTPEVICSTCRTRDAVVGAARQLRQVADHGVVETLDVAILDGGTDERRRDRFTTDIDIQRVLGVFAQLVGLEGDPPSLSTSRPLTRLSGT